MLNTAELMEAVLKAEVANNEEFHVVREGEAGGQRAMGYGASPGRAICVCVCGIGAAAEELHHLPMEILTSR